MTGLHKPLRGIVFFVGTAAVLALTALFASQPVQASRGPAKGEWRVLGPLHFQNLHVFPIVPASGALPVKTSEYITLDEGLKAGTVVVSETSAPLPMIRTRPPVNRRGGGAGIGFEEPLEPQTQQSAGVQTAERQAGSRQGFAAPQRGAQVNTLYLVNKSGRKLILLAGEMVVGGQQDRIVQKDGIVPPTGKPFDLSVFCVEQGRWHGDNSLVFSSPNNSIVKRGGIGGGGYSGVVADPTVRGEAQAGRGQGGVWAKVEQKNRTAGVAPSSGTYQATVASPKAQKDAKPFHDAIEPKMPKNAVGAVVAINGQIIWVDAFASAELFQAYWPKLLQSYIVDAMTTPAPPRPADGRVPRVLRSVPTAADALRYLEDKSGKSTFEGQTGVYQLTRTESAVHVIYELTDLSANPDIRLHLCKMQKGR